MYHVKGGLTYRVTDAYAYAIYFPCHWRLFHFHFHVRVTASFFILPMETALEVLAFGLFYALFFFFFFVAVTCGWVCYGC